MLMITLELLTPGNKEISSQSSVEKITLEVGLFKSNKSRPESGWFLKEEIGIF